MALGVEKSIESTLVREGNDEIEAVLGEIPVRIIVGNELQENALKDTKNKFWVFFEREVGEAELEGHGVIVGMDGNLHAGPALINPNPQNINGKLFMEFLDRNKSLTVVNSLNILCKDLITRRSDSKSRTEETYYSLLQPTTAY